MKRRGRNQFSMPRDYVDRMAEAEERGRIKIRAWIFLSALRIHLEQTARDGACYRDCIGCTISLGVPEWTSREQRRNALVKRS